LNDDIDIDNITLYNHHGYSEIFDKSDILMLMNNSYLKINYNDNKEDILKLKFKKDFMNNSLFVKKKKEWKNTEIKEAQIIKQEEVKEEEKKEETKPEEEKKEETPKKEETKPVINTPKEEPKVEEPVQEEITIEKIIEKIKEKGTYGPEGYFYETTIENNTITYMYGDAGDVVMMFDLLGDYWEYDGNTGRYTCTEILDNDLCKNHVHENAKKYLFN